MFSLFIYWLYRYPILFKKHFDLDNYRANSFIYNYFIIFINLGVLYNFLSHFLTSRKGEAGC